MTDPDTSMTSSPASAARPNAQQLDAAFKALASEQRRDILRLLAECCPHGDACGAGAGDVCACKISERLGLAPSTISHHMGILRSAGFVTVRKEGTWVHYALKRDALRLVSEELLNF